MAGEDPEYLAWLRLRKCSAPGPPHWGGDAHHPRHDETGPVGMSLRAHDHRAISLCRACHGHIEQRTGPFAGWSRERVRCWHDEQAARSRAIYLASLVSEFPA